MVKALFLILTTVWFTHKETLVNSVWAYKISNNCTNVLKLGSNNKASRYDCEMDYTFHDTYKINKDTLFLSEPDDAHSEDGGKITFYRYKYLIRERVLFCISS